MKLTDYIDNDDSDDDAESGSFDAEELHEEEHEQNDNWEWSDEFTEFVYDEIEGRSLKVCPGLRPICDVNLDIKHLGNVAVSDEAAFDCAPITTDSERLQDLRDTVSDDDEEDIIYGRITGKNNDTDGLYDGYACHGDMFDLPFEDNSFDTVVADPPWLNLSAADRRKLFEEIVRVTTPTGAILYNATWIPEDEHTRQFSLRFRQQLDYWGGPSFAAFYRRTARDVSELFDAHDYESAERYPADSVFWSEPYSPETLSTDHNTDPKKVSGDSDHQHYCCPMCGCAQLGHLRDEFFEADNGSYKTYECRNCAFRVDEAEVHALADALATAAAEQDIPVHEVTDIDHTPACIEQQLEHIKGEGSLSDVPFTADLPWVPEFEHMTEAGNHEVDVPDSLDTTDLSDVFSIIAAMPSVENRIEDDIAELPDSELQQRVETIARAVKETSLSHVRETIQTPTEDNEASMSSERTIAPAQRTVKTDTAIPPAAD